MLQIGEDVDYLLIPREVRLAGGVWRVISKPATKEAEFRERLTQFLEEEGRTLEDVARIIEKSTPHPPQPPKKPKEPRARRVQQMVTPPPRLVVGTYDSSNASDSELSDFELARGRGPGRGARRAQGSGRGRRVRRMPVSYLGSKFLGSDVESEDDQELVDAFLRRGEKQPAAPQLRRRVAVPVPTVEDPPGLRQSKADRWREYMGQVKRRVKGWAPRAGQGGDEARLAPPLVERDEAARQGSASLGLNVGDSAEGPVPETLPPQRRWKPKISWASFRRRRKEVAAPTALVTEGIAVQGEEAIVVQGQEVPAVQGAEAIVVHGAGVPPVQGVEAIAIQGAEAPAVQGSEAPTVQGAEAPAVQGAEAPAIQGAEAPAVQGAEAPAVQGAEAPAIQGAEAPAIQGAEAPAVQGAEAPDIQGAEAPAIQAAEAPDVQGAEAPAIQGAEAPAVQGAEAPAIQGAEAPVLQGAEAPVLQGAEAPAIQGAESPAVQGAEAPAVQGAEAIGDQRVGAPARLEVAAQEPTRATPAARARKQVKTVRFQTPRRFSWFRKRQRAFWHTPRLPTLPKRVPRTSEANSLRVLRAEARAEQGNQEDQL
ncbi:coiled-coil domain-containing protein 8 [Erinaceus europaeus]|uniref:Coiled-coil domain-containing protein 8 n=1 Tax=Erinaceus europaeus TaxID=9365 RepID=A0A1S3WNE2_ERIEU|nr:coiled-coil domain-containing protein 8 [Erinaceus europaeus]